MLTSPAAARNREPILKILRQYFDPNIEYKLLEIASGPGEHVAYFAEHMPNILFQPSEVNPRYIHSIVGYVDQYRLPNIRVPLFIDACKPPDFWALPKDCGPGQIDALLNINMIHISSNEAIHGLFRAASGLLKPRTGLLIIYGPFAVDGGISPQSNIDFDKYLRGENPEWGLRDVSEMEKLANYNDLNLKKIHEMPSNNHTLIFTKR
ncbi:methyltransferase-like 26 [Ditylenchus destructor]|nr:methyltransferase-like 26 [Ditylenchus destructor]